MDKPDLILKNTYTIASDDADFRCKLHISSLVNFYIQSAWQHAEAFKVGFSHLSTIGLGWVLSRFTLKLQHLPEWPGSISLTTWSKGLNRLFYMRDAELFDTQNKRFASVTSAWIIIDKQTKRPKIYNPDWLTDYHLKDKHAVNEDIPSLQCKGKPTISIPYKVQYSDIDMNQHLTTIRYVDLAFNTYDLEFIINNQPKEIAVNFLKEIPFGEQVVMHRFEHDNLHEFELVKKKEPTTCFRARITY